MIYRQTPPKQYFALLGECLNYKQKLQFVSKPGKADKSVLFFCKIAPGRGLEGKQLNQATKLNELNHLSGLPDLFAKVGVCK